MVAWNQAHHIGTKVRWTNTAGPVFKPCHTMGPAKIVCGRAVVWLMEAIGPTPLSELVPWANTKP